VRGAATKGRTPVLALTANALRGKALRAAAAGMDEYLTKPLQLHLLRAALAKWLPRDAADTVVGDLPEPSEATERASALIVGVLKEAIGHDAGKVREVLTAHRITVAIRGRSVESRTTPPSSARLRSS
jgi:DNA-binding response OmpR family regulator